MLQRLILILILILDAHLAFGTGFSSADRYWISYQGKAVGFQPAGSIYLLQINALGQITTGPIRVVSGFMFHHGTASTAIELNGRNNLTIWIASEELPSLHGFIYRGLIRKRDHVLLHFTKTPLQTTNARFIQVTQRATENFLMFRGITPIGQDNLVGYRILPNGLLTGRFFAASPNVLGTDNCRVSGCGGSISADGLAVLQLNSLIPNFKDVIYERLKFHGRHTEVRTLVARVHGVYSSISSADVTNPLSGSTRFVAFLSTLAELHSSDPSKLFLQPVESLTGRAIGDKVLLSTFFFGGGQEIAIDPLGRFVVYILALPLDHPSPPFSPDLYGLVYQAVDATGHPSGRPKLLTRRAYSGIDMVKD